MHINDHNLNDGVEEDLLLNTIKALSGPIATILVGPPGFAERFSIHEGLLSLDCGFIKGAFRGRGNFREKNELTISLPETEPRTFDLFVQWLYANINADNDNHTIILRYNDEFRSAGVDDLLRLHWLADFLQCEVLTRSVKDALKHDGEDMSTEQAPTVNEVEYVYDNADEDEQFQKVALARFLRQNENLDEVADPDDYPARFWFDVAKKEREMRNEMKKIEARAARSRPRVVGLGDNPRGLM